MTHDDRAANQALTEAISTIARQGGEIERLQRELGDEAIARRLRDALLLASATGSIAAPTTRGRLLELIVETAATVTAAQAASLFLVDEQANELIFEVALGQRADDIRGIRIPLGHGIAGLVAASGHAMTISDARTDPRHAADIADRIGYMPDSILAVPLSLNEEVIGVLELLDKAGGASFAPSDMETASLFASQAAIAVQLSHTRENLSAFLVNILSTTEGHLVAAMPDLARDAQIFATQSAQDPAYGRALELAGLVHEIVIGGDDELRACRTILEGFAQYLRSSRAYSSELEVAW